MNFHLKYFKINLFGVKFVLGVLIHGESSEGIINVQSILSILDINIPYIHTINSNVGNIILKYTNSILSIGKKLSEKWSLLEFKLKIIG